MRVGATVFAVCILLSACDNRNSDVAPVMVAGRAVEGITPGAAFLAACTRSYQGIQFVETGASVQKLVQSLRLAPSAVVRWERVSPTTYILRLTNNDPLTRQSAEVGMQMDRAIEATATPNCGVGVVDISRITVNGAELQPVGHFNALLSLIDFERLAQEHLAGQSHIANSSSEVQTEALATTKADIEAADAFSIREPVENFWNDWTFQETSTWAGDPIEATVNVEGKTRSYGGTVEVICSQNGRVIYNLRDGSGQSVNPLEVPETISRQLAERVC